MTEADQIELLAWNEYTHGPDWASDEFELRQQAVNIVDRAFEQFDGHHTRPVEVVRPPVGLPWVGELSTLPVGGTQSWAHKRIQLFPGLKREEALLITEEFLRS